MLPLILRFLLARFARKEGAKMFKNLAIKLIEKRAAAQHVSVAALAIGTVASLLGVTLAPEQVSALVTGASVVVYVANTVYEKYIAKKAE